MPDSTVPEIKRVNLTSTVLTLKSLGIKDVLGFDYLDSPERESIEEALKMLYYLEALDMKGTLTPLGHVLGAFPLEPQFAKCLLAYARTHSRYDDMLALVSVLSTENIWTAVSRQDQHGQERLEEAKRQVAVAGSDHMTLVRVFEQWAGQRQGEREGWCYRH